MCRFAVYRGPPIRMSALVTDPEHSIIRQSARSHEGIEPMNGDGYGLAWYVPHLLAEPVLFREVTPAWNSPNLASLARATESGTVFAHVRAATEGSAVTLLNCHPFARGTLAFMHNGAIGGFGKLRRSLRAGLSDASYDAIAGGTDSEHLFAWFIDHFDADATVDPLERMAGALAHTFFDLDALGREKGITESSRLNIALTDGQRVVASRCNLGEGASTNSLYMRQGRYACSDGVARLGPEGDHAACVMIASEPLTSEADWHRVPEQHFVLVDTDLSVEIRPLSAWARPRAGAQGAAP